MSDNGWPVAEGGRAHSQPGLLPTRVAAPLWLPWLDPGGAPLAVPIMLFPCAMRHAPCAMRASRPVRGQRRPLKISTRIRKALWSSSLRKPGPPCTVAHEAHPCTTSGLSSPTQTAITRAGVLRRGFLPLGDTFTSTRPDEAMFTVGDVVPGPSICLVLVRPAVAVLVLKLPVADVEPPRFALTHSASPVIGPPQDQR